MFGWDVYILHTLIRKEILVLACEELNIRRRLLTWRAFSNLKKKKNNRNNEKKKTENEKGLLLLPERQNLPCVSFSCSLLVVAYSVNRELPRRVSVRQLYCLQFASRWLVILEYIVTLLELTLISVNTCQCIS